MIFTLFTNSCATTDGLHYNVKLNGIYNIVKNGPIFVIVSDDREACYDVFANGHANEYLQKLAGHREFVSGHLVHGKLKLHAPTYTTIGGDIGVSSAASAKIDGQRLFMQCTNNELFEFKAN